MSDTIENVPPLRFSETELAMLGKTADALSAYLGAAVLAEVGESDGAQWAIFAKALGQDDDPGNDVVHVQLGGPGSQVLGQRGGLATERQAFDCDFLWAIQINDDEQQRYVRLDPAGEIVDAAADLAELLPFSLTEPDALDDDSGDADSPENDDRDDTAFYQDAPPTRH